MPRSRPTHRVTRIDGETGKTTTVGRHTTSDAAAQARLDRRAEAPRGSSDSFGVREIQARGGR